MKEHTTSFYIFLAKPFYTLLPNSWLQLLLFSPFLIIGITAYSMGLRNASLPFLCITLIHYLKQCLYPILGHNTREKLFPMLQQYIWVTIFYNKVIHSFIIQQLFSLYYMLDTSFRCLGPQKWSGQVGLISFCCACVLSPVIHVPLFLIPWTTAHYVPLSMGFPRQEYWSQLSFPSPGDLPNPGILYHLATREGFPGGTAAAKSLQSCPTLCRPIDGR